MTVTVVTPPAIEPVSLERALAQLNGPLEQDAKISDLITTARMDAESYTNRAFIQQTLRFTAGSCFFVYGAAWTWRHWHGRGILLPRQPIVSVESVSYYDTDNAAQDVADDNYYLTAGGYLQFVSGYSYPSAYMREDALQIEYTAGYGTTAMSVPQPIRQAILLGVDLLWSPLTPDERKAMELARNELLRPYRIEMGV
jgi:uncharacterized phiE125 gp8 family phage protein